MNNLIVSKETINDALDFYNITDENYKNKCYECLASIQINDNLINKFNHIYEILYLSNFDRAKLKKLWSNQNIEAIFEKNCHPFITNILLLSGYTLHIKNINKHSLDNSQKEIHLKRVYESLTTDIYERNYDGIRVSQMLWGAYFVNMRIIEVGRLQYELCFHNPVTDETGEQSIKIHIPRGTKLFIDNVKKSISDSKSYIKKYFNLENPNYYCSSWLLSKELHEVIDKDSNIYKFYDLFDILKIGGDATSDIMNFVFRLENCDDYKTLPESTSLQRKIKAMLVSNTSITLGIGKLKQNILEEF